MKAHWSERLALGLYSAAMVLAQPLLRLKLLLRSRKEPAYGQDVAQRFGCYAGLAPTDKPFIWVHAVSLGETRVAAVLIDALRAQHPRLRLLISK